MSKRVNQWNRYREKLKKLYFEKGIIYCEIGLENCWRDNGLSFHHKHKRSWYYDNLKLLGKFEQTIQCCIECHGKLERDKEKHDYYFKKLR